MGESGSGKSLTALSIAGLVEEPASVDARHLTFCGTDLLGEPAAGQTHDKLLGTSLAVVFQDPMTSFNPTMRIGAQLAEVGRHHQGLDRKEASARAVDRLRAVRVRDPDGGPASTPSSSRWHASASGAATTAVGDVGRVVVGPPPVVPAVREAVPDAPAPPVAAAPDVPAPSASAPAAPPPTAEAPVALVAAVRARDRHGRSRARRRRRDPFRGGRGTGGAAAAVPAAVVPTSGQG